jgi:hypothetical protein
MVRTFQVDDLNGLLQVRAVRREWQMARKQQHFLTMFKQYRSHFDQEVGAFSCLLDCCARM